MQVVYTGRHGAVEVKGLGRAERGEPFEVDKDTAAQLIAQGWREAPTKKDKN